MFKSLINLFGVPLVFIVVVYPLHGWSHLSYFPIGDTRCSSVVFEAVDVPCPGPLHFSNVADYIYDVCPLSDLNSISLN